VVGVKEPNRTRFEAALALAAASWLGLNMNLGLFHTKIYSIQK
jgi:hypothetical protein